ncbi:envelope glycoprotein L [Equid gammaherpesvirus 2]|nr:envelope glycoprotein L [Equid gammaherpesvirus 2]UTM04589.1 envelope glycoprotein L [Equid gammaherpesvirus 2]UTM05293.1 envelope glycoprotein L [Equid gammaherpesvirus 2]
MRSLDRYAIFILLACGLLWRPCLSSLPMPCCHILTKDVSGPPSVFEVKEIFFNYPKTCNNTNVAQFRYVPEGKNASTFVCANGFNLMSFILGVLQRVFEKTHDMGRLAEDLNKLRTEYALNFTAVNSETSKFNVIRNNGTLATTPRVEQRSRRSTGFGKTAG